MADNTQTGATGVTIATDDVGGVQFQKVKLDVGTDGQTQEVSTAAPLPIKDSTAPYDQALTAAAGVDVATTSTTVVTDSAGARKLVILSNGSDTDIWVALGTTATLNNGIMLTKVTGAAPRLVLDYSGPISAIHGGTGTKRVGVAAF